MRASRFIARWYSWAFWSVVYLPVPWSTDLGKSLIRISRTVPPRRWKPHVFRNDDGHMWQVLLKNQATYTTQKTMKLDVHVSQETGEIVGLNLWDELLKTGSRPEQEPVEVVR